VCKVLFSEVSSSCLLLLFRAPVETYSQLSTAKGRLCIMPSVPLRGLTIHLVKYNLMASLKHVLTIVFDRFCFHTYRLLFRCPMPLCDFPYGYLSRSDHCESQVAAREQTGSEAALESVKVN
jgi:hypothetical protein